MIFAALSKHCHSSQSCFANLLPLNNFDLFIRFILSMETLSAIVDKTPKLKNPGFLLKTHNINDCRKCFINFCYSNSVSPPTIQLSAKELEGLIEKEAFDELSQFTIPLVLEQLEYTTDKKGQTALVTHAIINEKLYKETIMISEIYKRFLIFVTIETINLKFGLKLSFNSYVIMKNKIHQLPNNVNVFNKIINAYVPPSKKIINSLNDVQLISEDQKLLEIADETVAEIVEVEDQENGAKINNNVIINLNIQLDLVYIYVKFTKTNINFEDLKLLLNDDRIVIKNQNKIVNDFNVTFCLKPDQAYASFKNNTLTIKCPVLL